MPPTAGVPGDLRQLSRSSLVCVELSCNWATSNVPWSCSRRQRPWREPWMIRINWGASPPMARYCFLMGEHDVARAASERALRLATDHQDFALQVTAQMYLGQVYHALGQYPRALEVLGQNVIALTDDLLYEHFGMANLPIVTSRIFSPIVWLNRGRSRKGACVVQRGCGSQRRLRMRIVSRLPVLAAARLALNAGDLPQAITA